MTTPNIINATKSTVLPGHVLISSLNMSIKSIENWSHALGELTVTPDSAIRINTTHQRIAENHDHINTFMDEVAYRANNTADPDENSAELISVDVLLGQLAIEINSSEQYARLCGQYCTNNPATKAIIETNRENVAQRIQHILFTLSFYI